MPLLNDSNRVNHFVGLGLLSKKELFKVLKEVFSSDDKKFQTLIPELAFAVNQLKNSKSILNELLQTGLDPSQKDKFEIFQGYLALQKHPEDFFEMCKKYSNGQEEQPLIKQTDKQLTEKTVNQEPNQSDGSNSKISKTTYTVMNTPKSSFLDSIIAFFYPRKKKEFLPLQQPYDKIGIESSKDNSEYNNNTAYKLHNQL